MFLILDALPLSLSLHLIASWNVPCNQVTEEEKMSLIYRFFCMT